MKILIKILSILITTIIIVIIYLSIFGLNTKKFNNQIKDKIIGLNKKIEIEIKDVRFLLNPFNFSINIKTLATEIIIGENRIELENIRSNVSIKSLVKNEFPLDNLSISTKKIQVNDIVLLARSFKNSPQLFFLNKIVKDGFLIADIDFNFDSYGRIKKDYLIKGFVKKGKLDFLKKYQVDNLDLIFRITDKEYYFEELSANFNQLRLSSASLKIENKKDLFLIEGKILTDKKNNYIKFFKELPNSILNNKDLVDINLESINDFSFELSKKFKVNNLILKSEIFLSNLELKNDKLGIENYFPNFKKLIQFKDHKIMVDYNREELNISGKGNLLIESKIEKIDYKIKNKENKYFFNTNLNIFNNEIHIDILNYKKKEKIKSKLYIEGIYDKNKQTKFNTILFTENKNRFLVKELTLNNKFNISNLIQLNFLFENINEIQNQLVLKKNKKNYTLEGNSFDASKIVDLIFKDTNNKSLSGVFNKFNNEFNIKIKKVYLDNEYYVNDFNGNLSLLKSEIVSLDITSNYNQDKILTISIKNKDGNKIIALYSDYARPFVKKFKFIKGFEDGSLDYNSIKIKEKTYVKLKIYDFKLQELPILTKLLTLASLQGIADLLSGEGIRFNDFEMTYNSNKKLMTIEEIYALGPAISILMDGYIEKDKLVSLRGTLVPATTINKAIGSIPLLGDILVGKKAGEGVFGVSFKIKGNQKNLKTTVNPIKTLTPRFITRTLEKIKKNN